MKGSIQEIYNVFNKGNNYLEIPIYQRNYDWGIAQCDDAMRALCT